MYLIKMYLVKMRIVSQEQNEQMYKHTQKTPCFILLEFSYDNFATLLEW